MIDWGALLRKHKLFLFLLGLRYLVPFILFGGIHARVHDNLDSEAVYSVVIGRFWASGWDTAALEVFLGGTLDWTYFARVLQPIGLIYAAFDPGPAYLLTELLNLVLAYAGMRLLLTLLEVPQWDRGLLACLFAFGLSFTSYGTGLSAAPLLMALTLRDDNRVRADEVLLAVLLGANASLALHGIFIPIAALVLIAMAGRWPGGARFAWIQGGHLAGSTIAAVGLIMNALGGVPMHRAEFKWPVPEAPLRHFADEAISNLLTQADAYHATMTPALYTAVVLLAALFIGKRLRRGALLLISLIVLATALDTFKGVIGPALPGPISSIQFQRIELFACLLIIVLAGMVLKSAPFGWGSRGVRAAVAASLALFALTGMGIKTRFNVTLPARVKPEISAKMEKGDGADAFRLLLAGLGVRVAALAEIGATFDRYFRSKEYQCLARTIGTKRVISFGPDPMIAPFHGIAAVDGYHNLYPLSYKHAFRPIISAKLATSPSLAQYYDGWGSRVGTFPNRVSVVKPDFAAARTLGAEFVISDQTVSDPSLTRLPIDCGGALQLYRIDQT